MSVRMVTLSDSRTIISQTTDRFDIIHTYINKIIFSLFVGVLFLLIQLIQIRFS